MSVKPALGPSAPDTEGVLGDLLSISAEVLQLEMLEGDDDFEAAGADSVVMIEIVHRLRERHDCDVSLEDALDARTPRELAETTARLLAEGGARG